MPQKKLMEGVASTLWVSVEQMGLHGEDLAIEFSLRVLAESNLQQTRALIDIRCIAFTCSREVRTNRPPQAGRLSSGTL